jgi:hypothetical protein
MQVIDKIYKNPDTGFISANKLYEKVKQENPKITLKQVKEYLKNSPTQQLHTQKKKPITEAKIYGAIGQYQLDLTFYNQYKKQNSNYHIILVAVEINTRYAYTIALKSKSQESITGALKELITKMTNDKRTPTIFQSDNGSEFKNNSVSKLLDEYKIQQFFCQENDKKCLAIAERFNRTIKALINKYMTENNTTKWIDVLQNFTNNYNNTIHSTLKMKPKDVDKKEQIEFIKDAREHNLFVSQSHDIKVGDSVRLPLSKSKFEKEGKNFSDEVYKVSNVMVSSLNVEGKKKKYRIAEVLKVPANSKQVDTKEITKAKRNATVDRKISKEGLDTTNIKTRASRQASLNATAINKILLEK